MSKPKIKNFLFFVFLILLSGCLGRELTRIDPLTESYILEEVPVQSFAGVDILVVVDNSGSMAQEQNMLKEAFPNLVRDLLNPPIDPTTGQRTHAPVRDLHIGVVSTDLGVAGYPVPSCERNPMVGDDAILQHTPRLPDCDPAYDTYLHYSLPQGQDPDPTTVEDLAKDFGCIAVLGTSGCGFEQQLEAARRALYEKSQPGMDNAGFLRNDSILTILIVSDEEDCSAADPTLFDVQAIPWDINLQCFYNKDKQFQTQRYIDDFKNLRCSTGPGTCLDTPDNLVVGFIVGVPPGSVCENPGDRLGGCLEEPAMQERVNSTQTMVEWVCSYPPGCTPTVNCSTEAFPGRRYVEVAQGLGDNAIVQSICTDTFVPAVQALTNKLKEALDKLGFHRYLETEKDPDDPCRCVSTCTIVEELSDNRPCPPEKPPYDGDGDGVGDTKLDPETNQVHTLCEIPQAGAQTSRCDLPCDSAEATYTKYPGKEGWWYNPYEPAMTGKLPTIHLEGVLPAAGSGVGIQCRSVVCPTTRKCGSQSSPDSKCCNINEFCYPPPDDQFRKNNEGYCLLREDICEQFGENTWCPGYGPLAGDPLIGGLCCVDHNWDGKLDLTDTDGDGLLDSPTHECVAGACTQVR